MLTLDMLKEIAHKNGRTRRDVALVALAYPDLRPKSLDALRRCLAEAGVAKAEQRLLPSTLSRAQGLSIRTPDGWELSSRGRRRVELILGEIGGDFAAVSVRRDSANGHVAPPSVFIGHGHSPIWREVKDFVVDRLCCRYEEFNREPAAGISNSGRLESMLRQASFALLVMTSDDELTGGAFRARQNVVHECGLFQSRLGFSRAIILREEGCEKFSNADGLSDIPFPKGRVSATFEEIRRVMEREGLI